MAYTYTHTHMHNWGGRNDRSRVSRRRLYLYVSVSYYTYFHKTVRIDLVNWSCLLPKYKRLLFIEKKSDFLRLLRRRHAIPLLCKMRFGSKHHTRNHVTCAWGNEMSFDCALRSLMFSSGRGVVMKKRLYRSLSFSRIFCCNLYWRMFVYYNFENACYSVHFLSKLMQFKLLKTKSEKSATHFSRQCLVTAWNFSKNTIFSCRSPKVVSTLVI